MTWKGGQGAIKLLLDVWDFALPQENHLPGNIWNGSMREMPAGEELAYYQLARQHRFLPLIYAYRPALKIDGTKVTLDWKDFDRRLASVSGRLGFYFRTWLLGSGLRVAARRHHAAVQQRKKRGQENGLAHGTA